jgi:hypothetical protein
LTSPCASNELVNIPATLTSKLCISYELNIKDTPTRETVRRILQSAFSKLQDDKKP